MRVESRERPANKFILDNRKGNLIEVAFFDDIKSEMKKEQGSETEIEVFTYKVYKITTIFRDDLEENIQNNYEEWLESLKEKEKEDLAEEIREKRNKLLEESDKSMAFDRLGISFPDFNFSESLSLTNIVSYIKNLVTAIKTFAEEFQKINNSEIAKYRQQLRDITKQSGFPYDVEFPTKPDEK